jgi:FtsP/CotA-like multicopper oxidase with cupredoxin domain
MNFPIQIFVASLLAFLSVHAVAVSVDSVCPRPSEGSMIPDLPQVKSSKGMLSTSLTARNAGLGPEVGQNNPIPNYDYRFCLLEHNLLKRSSPVLRVKPGDLVRLELVDELLPLAGFPTPHVHTANSCVINQNLEQASIATFNMHYHGLNIPPTCGADDVLNTVIQPHDGTPGNVFKFTYHFRIPATDPPGLFWYHPHIHGIAQEQLLGGMTGLLVVEGMDQHFPEIKGIQERILILRDLDKSNPADDPNSPADEPWKNVSVNSVPVIYGSSKSPTLEMGANERQFWRVANASADTHFALQFQFNRPPSKLKHPRETVDGWQAQNLELLARDGVPVLTVLGKPHVSQIVLPPGSRAEFIVTGPPDGVPARLYSADYNDYLDAKTAGCSPNFPQSVCDNTDRNPARVLANIVTTPAVAGKEKAGIASLSPFLEGPLGQLRRFANIEHESVGKTRTLFFTKNPADDGDFFITVAGKTPKPFDMTGPPDITVSGPTVEDWIVENRDNESHDFHIHQIHFKVIEDYDPSNDDNSRNVLRDTIEIPACRQWADGIDPENDPYGLNFPPESTRNDSAFTGKNCVRPSRVKLRMDFRDRDIVGTFVYHCHILEHEDHGMMAKFQIK